MSEQQHSEKNGFGDHDAATILKRLENGNPQSTRKRKRYKSSPHHRRRTFAEQGGFCHYCKKSTAFEKWTVDHKLPICRGGTNGRENKVGCCDACNRGKGCLTEDEFRAAQPKERKKKITEIQKMLDAYNAGDTVASQ